MKRILENNTVLYLHPGELHFSNKSLVVTTVLGSCIAITMYDPVSKFSAISHCQLPKCNSNGCNCKNCNSSYKYVNCTIKAMIEKFELRKIKISDLEVKLFGGSDVLKKTNNNDYTVGKQNIEEAENELKKLGIKIKAFDTGGTRGRKLHFVTHTGDVYLTRLKGNEKN